MELPLIDLAALLPNAPTPLPADKRAAALGALRESLTTVGFFYLTNHGVSVEVQQRLLAATAAFFHLPATEKEAAALSARPATGRGYQRLRESVTAGAADVHEAVDLYATLEPADPSLSAAVATLRAAAPDGVRAEAAAAALTTFATADNVRLPTALQAALDAYVAAARRAAVATLGLVAEAVGVPARQASGLAAGAFWNARLIHYPPVAPVPEAPAGGGGGGAVGGGNGETITTEETTTTTSNGTETTTTTTTATTTKSVAGGGTGDELGCGAHCDYGLLTLVLQSTEPAARGCLQVWAPDVDGGAGCWVAADPPVGSPPDTLVVNVGDWLAAASGGALRSSRHRVVQPSRGVPRNSVPFFFEPALHAVPPTAPPAAVAAGSPVALATRSGSPVSCYGEFLLGKVAGNFAFSTAGGVRL